MNRAISFLCVASLASGLSPVWGFSGTEGASFLDIPAGGRPAAMGGAYSALAEDAYAPVWNPAGLGRLRQSELSFMHLSYLESMSYEFASAAHSLAPGRGLGASVQFFRPGDVDATDASGNPAGEVSGRYGAYSLSYGQALPGGFSAGAAVKFIEARLAGVSASAVAFDLAGGLRVNERLSLAAVVANVGTGLRFLSQRDPLPLAARLGAGWAPRHGLTLALEGFFARTGTPGARLGAEWRPWPALAVRAGYRTDSLRELSAAAGVTTGLGLELLGQRFDYAFVPLGDLGGTQYFSLVFRLGGGSGRAETPMTGGLAPAPEEARAGFGPEPVPPQIGR